MKLTKMFFYTALVAVLFSACKSEIDVTGVTLDESAVSVAIKDSVQLTATILPKGATGTVVWSSSNEAVATVKDGKVKGVSLGTANIKATVGTLSAVCAVTVTKEIVDFASSLKGTEYYLISMDGATATKLGNKVIADFRPDEDKKFLYVWNGFSPLTVSGPNCFGEVDTWVGLSVTPNTTWSGAGFFCKDGTILNKLVPITTNPDKYYLHIAIKSKSTATFVFGLEGQSNTRFAIGSQPFIDVDKTYVPIADFPRDGEWQKIEIPMSTLKANGLLYSTGLTDKNVFLFLAGSAAGTEINIDGVFIYKKP